MSVKKTKGRKDKYYFLNTYPSFFPQFLLDFLRNRSLLQTGLFMYCISSSNTIRMDFFFSFFSTSIFFSSLVVALCNVFYDHYHYCFSFWNRNTCEIILPRNSLCATTVRGVEWSGIVLFDPSSWTTYLLRRTERVLFIYFCSMLKALWEKIYICF